MSLLGVAPLHFDRVRLPIGISFFTFHALSYVIDVYRRKWTAARNPCDVALYILFLSAVDRRADPALERHRATTRQTHYYPRGLCGRGPAVFGRVGEENDCRQCGGGPADQIFALSGAELTPVLAWFGTLCYTGADLFDFSGYSDMAVGLGKMFGFQFLETSTSRISPNPLRSSGAAGTSPCRAGSGIISTSAGRQPVFREAELREPRCWSSSCAACGTARAGLSDLGAVSRESSWCSSRTRFGSAAPGAAVASAAARLHFVAGDGGVGAVPGREFFPGSGFPAEHGRLEHCAALGPTIRTLCEPTGALVNRSGTGFFDAVLAVGERSGGGESDRPLPAWLQIAVQASGLVLETVVLVTLLLVSAAGWPEALTTPSFTSGFSANEPPLNPRENPRGQAWLVTVVFLVFDMAADGGLGLSP